jgi:hypothetical protein
MSRGKQIRSTSRQPPNIGEFWHNTCRIILRCLYFSSRNGDTIMSSELDSSLYQSHRTSILGGSVPPPPTELVGPASKPPQLSDEANQQLAKSEVAPEAASTLTDDDETIWRAAAMELGQTSYFRFASKSWRFEQAEDELACDWDTSQQTTEQRISWQRAREFARDAWDQARSALESGDAKPSAR